MTEFLTPEESLDSAEQKIAPEIGVQSELDFKFALADQIKELRNPDILNAIAVPMGNPANSESVSSKRVDIDGFRADFIPLQTGLTINLQRLQEDYDPASTDEYVEDLMVLLKKRIIYSLLGVRSDKLAVSEESSVRAKPLEIYRIIQKVGDQNVQTEKVYSSADKETGSVLKALLTHYQSLSIPEDQVVWNGNLVTEVTNTATLNESVAQALMFVLLNPKVSTSEVQSQEKYNKFVSAIASNSPNPDVFARFVLYARTYFTQEKLEELLSENVFNSQDIEAVMTNHSVFISELAFYQLTEGSKMRRKNADAIKDSVKLIYQPKPVHPEHYSLQTVRHIVDAHAYFYQRIIDYPDTSFVYPLPQFDQDIANLEKLLLEIKNQQSTDTQLLSEAENAITEAKKLRIELGKRFMVATLDNLPEAKDTETRFTPISRASTTLVNESKHPTTLVAARSGREALDRLTEEESLKTKELYRNANIKRRYQEKQEAKHRRQMLKNKGLL